MSSHTIDKKAMGIELVVRTPMMFSDIARRLFDYHDTHPFNPKVLIDNGANEGIIIGPEQKPRGYVRQNGKILRVGEAYYDKSGILQHEFRAFKDRVYHNGRWVLLRVDSLEDI